MLLSRSRGTSMRSGPCSMALHQRLQHGQVALGGLLLACSNHRAPSTRPVASSMKAIRQHLADRPSNQS